MVVSKVIISIMTLFFAFGAIDRCLGNKFGVGKEFERAFGLMGPTALTSVGLIVASPVIARVIQPVVVPVYNFLGADAAMFSGTFLSPDTGGYSIAAELASDPQLALFGGLIVAAVMGATVSFAIPVAYGLIEKKDAKYLAAGILSGFVFDPLACFFGGLAMGLSPLVVLKNLVPVIIIALVIVICLIFTPNVIIKVFRIFAKCLLVLVTLGLLAGAVEKLLGITVIDGLTPIDNGFLILGSVVLSLGGALPLAFVLNRVLKKPLRRLGEKIGINDTAVIAIVISITSVVTAFASFKDMNVRGKVVVSAITASMANLLGAHFGFTSTIDQTILGPMLLAKILAGVFAVPTAIFFSNRLFSEDIKAERLAETNINV